MLNISITIVAISFIAMAFIWSAGCTLCKRHRGKKYSDYKTVPEVEGKLPIAGHGLEVGKDIMQFIRKCYRKYGKIFKIKIFRNEIIVVCDRSMLNDYFSQPEENMSLYKVLKGLYFGDAFSDDPESLDRIIALVKSTIAVRSQEFLPKIMSEAKKMTERLKAKASQKTPIDLTREAVKFVSSTSAQCFLSMGISDELFENVLKFTNLLNIIVKLTYLFPKWFLRLVFNPYLKRYRYKIRSAFEPEIQKYRQDPKKNESPVLRKCVDYLNSSLTNEQISDVIICLLYVSTENTALGLSASVTDLGCHKSFWDRVKEETGKHLADSDFASLVASPTLDACVMESARLNAHVFSLQRRPVNKLTLGGYYVGDVDSIGVCGPMMMSFDCAGDTFADPLTYNPDRFLTGVGNGRKESTGSSEVLTWGTGKHLCPGKLFSILEIKAALALIANTFEYFNLTEDQIGERDMFSPSAFAERRVFLTMNQLPEAFPSNVAENSPQVENIDGKGWLIRNYLSVEEQKDFYKYTVELSRGTSEQVEMLSAPADRTYCLSYYNLVHTGKSNCEEPTKWLDLARKVWGILNANRERINFPKVDHGDFNSVYCQLFGNEGKMDIHKDEFVTYGISISIGASCEFLFGERTIVLNSGDVFVSDFSQVLHGVLGIRSMTRPEWFDEEGVETFGRSRLSVQIRHVKQRDPAEYMEMSAFKRMITQA